MLVRTKLSTAIKAAVLIGSGLTAMNSMAEELVEEVVVTGIRASLQDAQAAKRNAAYVSDVISAEDVGKFPDKNIADALSRMTGVAISRDFGEGEKVSIRGAGPDWNRTTLNGQTVGSADWFILDNPARSFNFTLLPSTLISQLEVIKSPTAAQTEGSLGGTVNVKTHRPLDLEAGAGVVSVDAQYGSMSEEWDPSVSGQYSWKSDDETVGLLVSAVRQNRTVQREGFEVLGWSNSITPNGEWAPTVMGAPQFNQDRERSTIFASAQYAPSDELLFTLDVLDTKMDSNNMNSNWLAWTGSAATNTISGNGTQVAGADDGKVGVNFINRVSSAETQSFTLTSEFENDNFAVDVVVGSTKAKGGTYRETSWEYVDGNGSYDYDLSGTPSLDVTPDPSVGSNFAAGWIWGGEKPTTDEETYFQADLEIPVEMGAFTAIKAGVKYREAERTQERNVYSWHGPETLDDPSVAPGWPVYLQAIFDACPTLAACGLDGLGVDHLDTAVGGNITSAVDQVREIMEEIAFVGVTMPDGTWVPADYAVSRELANNWAVTEDIFAAYVQADFEAGAISGNVGLRYVTTDQASSGYEFSSDSWGFETIDRDWLMPSFVEWVTVENDYSELLPSLNVAYELNDDMKLRFAAARVMARQNWNTISPFVTFGDLNTADPKGQAGNPMLDPNIATQLDASFEWYYGEASSFAATLFYKDNKSYLEGREFTEERYNEQTDQMVDVDFTYQVNGAGGSVQGLELAVTHSLDNGFGGSANYTYTDISNDSAASAGPIGISEHMANITGYFETEQISAAVMYNYRSDWSNGLHWNGNPYSTEAYGQFDAKVSYYLNDSLELSAEALNLTNEEIRQYSVHEDRLMSLYENGRRLHVGATYRF